MTPSIEVACGFLGGMIFSVPGGYRVLPHSCPERIFSRIADARWYLAINWCDRAPAAAAILNHGGELSFVNQAVLEMGETAFLPLEHRRALFDACLTLGPGETARYEIQRSGTSHSLEVLGLDIDPRYGRVAAVRALVQS